MPSRYSTGIQRWTGTCLFSSDSLNHWKCGQLFGKILSFQAKLYPTSNERYISLEWSWKWLQRDITKTETNTASTFKSEYQLLSGHKKSCRWTWITFWQVTLVMTKGSPALHKSTLTSRFYLCGIHGMEYFRWLNSFHYHIYIQWIVHACSIAGKFTSIQEYISWFSVIWWWHVRLS